MSAVVKRRRGRPRIGQETKVVLTEEQREWLDTQPEAMAVVIRGLINQAMKAERAK